MHELPESVRERLAAAQGASVEHPDADLLTAFAEGSLSGHERQEVLAHLGTCVQCREVIALAGSAVETATPVLAAPPLRRSSWPMFRRFAVAAAAVVVVVGAVTLRGPWLRKQSSPEIVAMQKQAESAQEKPASPATVPAQEEKREELKQRDSRSKESETTELDTLAGRRDGAPSPRADEAQLAKKDRDFKLTVPRSSGSVIGGLTQPRAMASLDTAPVRRQPVPPPPPPAGAVGGTLFSANQEQQQRQSINQAQNAAGDYSNQIAYNDQFNNGQAADSNQTVNTGRSGLQAATNQATNQQAARAAPPAAPPVSNQVTSATETVEVTAAAPLSPAESATASAAKPAARAAKALAPVSFHWTISPEGYLLRSAVQPEAWARVSAPNGDKVRSVSANGRDIWVATLPGRLYHSTDAGLTWSPVQLPAAGPAIAVHFDDAMQGSVTIGAHQNGKPAALADKAKTQTQLWTTRDGGRTWQKQD